jgi:WD40 repeat protein
LATGSTDGDVTVWDVLNGDALLTLKGGDEDWGATHISICFSPDGRRLAASLDYELKVWDAISGKKQLTLKETSTM